MAGSPIRSTSARARWMWQGLLCLGRPPLVQLQESSMVFEPIIMYHPHRQRSIPNSPHWQTYTLALTHAPYKAAPPADINGRCNPAHKVPNLGYASL